MMNFIKKTIKFLLIAFSCIISVLLLINLAIVLSTAQNRISMDEVNNQKSDCIIVLGCSVYGNTPSQMLKERLDTAITLYKVGAAPKILMSGDHYSDPYYNEVGTMKNYVVAQGIPAEDVFLDHYGLSTYETAYRAKETFLIKNAIVVTQSYHLSRAVYDLKRFGINVIGVKCDSKQNNIPFEYRVREVVARIKDFIYCITKPEPTYLGDTIPVTGNGNNTNERS